MQNTNRQCLKFYTQHNNSLDRKNLWHAVNIMSDLMTSCTTFTKILLRLSQEMFQFLCMKFKCAISLFKIKLKMCPKYTDAPASCLEWTTGLFLTLLHSQIFSYQTSHHYRQKQLNDSKSLNHEVQVSGPYQNQYQKNEACSSNSIETIRQNHCTTKYRSLTYIYIVGQT